MTDYSKLATAKSRPKGNHNVGQEKEIVECIVN